MIAYDAGVKPSSRRRRHTVSVACEQSALSENRLAVFDFYGRALHRAILQLLRRRRVAGFSVDLVVTGDMVTTVAKLSPPSDTNPRVFTDERLGGVVAAKLLPSDDEAKPYTIVMRDILWEEAGDEALCRAAGMLAHELGHCAVKRCREAAGYAPPAPSADIPWGESVAREIVIAATEEFHVDLMENAVLGGLANAGLDEQAEPLRLHHLYGDDYSVTLGEVLDGEVYPGWPDRVQAYRDWRVPLEEMWTGLARSAWETFILVAHAGAVANSAGFADPVAAGDYAEHPAVRLYLGEPWRRMYEAIAAVPPFCTPHALASAEARAHTDGIEAIVAMWRRLGLTFTLTPRGQHIGVVKPRRV